MEERRREEKGQKDAFIVSVFILKSVFVIPTGHQDGAHVARAVTRGILSYHSQVVNLSALQLP